MRTRDTDELMRDILARNFKPRTRLNTHEWAALNVRLDQRFTARPGFYDVNFTPYMRGPHEWFSDPYVQEITFAKSRQVGGTTFLANCMMYVVGEDPGPTLYVTSTRENAQSFAEREWHPRIDLSPSLSELKPDNSDDFKKIEQHFKTCTVKLTGSNSPANLMSRAIRYLFEDEVDTWPEDNGAEAPSVDIVEACTLSYAHTRKITRVSTPTVPTGTVWTRFLRGSQHKYHVPCPYCTHRFELLFEQLRFHGELCKGSDGTWDLDRLAETTTLECPNCHVEVDQKLQATMVHNGTWVQTNPNAPRSHISCHISALYSPTITWGQIAVIFIQKKDSPGGLHDFWNHYLGLPFIREATQVTETDIHRLRDSSPEYFIYTPKGKWVLPAEMAYIIMAVDVQQEGFWFGQRGISYEEDTYLLDYGPASSWDDLLELVHRVYKQPSGEDIRPYQGVIDSGYAAKRMSGVYDFCLSSGGLFVPVQGRSLAHGLLQPLREAQFEHRGQLINGLQIRDDMYKEKLYISKIKERAGSAMYVPRDIGLKYIKQLTDERLEPGKTERGTVILEWKDTGNNHLGDVEKYLLAFTDFLSPFLQVAREQRGKIEKVPAENEAPESMRILASETREPVVDVWAAGV